MDIAAVRSAMLLTQRETADTRPFHPTVLNKIIRFLAKQNIKNIHINMYYHRY
jgi:hypothetical protein